MHVCVFVCICLCISLPVLNYGMCETLVPIQVPNFIMLIMCSFFFFLGCGFFGILEVFAFLAYFLKAVNCICHSSLDSAAS